MKNNLNTSEQAQLNEAIYYMNMAELKALCLRLNLDKTSKKAFLINNILHYLKTGKTLTKPSIPDNMKGKPQELSAKALILKGAYKNDLATRNFFKKLIGAHFHFTAFGIDFINDSWLKGHAPSYQEFANFWQQEYEARKHKPAQPKTEWALLNFTQRYLKTNPKASRAEISKAWKQERETKVAQVQTLLRKLNL